MLSFPRDAARCPRRCLPSTATNSAALAAASNPVPRPPSLRADRENESATSHRPLVRQHRRRFPAAVQFLDPLLWRPDPMPPPAADPARPDSGALSTPAASRPAHELPQDANHSAAPAPDRQRRHPTSPLSPPPNRETALA